MRPQLMIELDKLEGPADEECAVSVSDSITFPGIIVLVQRSMAVLTGDKWGMYIEQGEQGAQVHIYRRLFETESEHEIAEAVQEVLDLPGVSKAS